MVARSRPPWGYAERGRLVGLLRSLATASRAVTTEAPHGPESRRGTIPGASMARSLLAIFQFPFRRAADLFDMCRRPIRRPQVRLLVEPHGGEMSATLGASSA